MPGRHINDHQMRLYMKHKLIEGLPRAAARAGHEIVMAIYESARRRARVDLPLDRAASPLEEMIAAGQI